MSFLLFCVLLGPEVAWSVPQLSPAKPEPIVGARRPAISPDGKKIAFQYRGDIWLVDSTGGVGVRLTSHVELETNPIWSPDGKWVAFSSDRNGNFDVFAIPVEGGSVRQITYSGLDEVATDWSPDGEWIAFTGRRDSPWTGIFLVNVNTLRFKLVAEDYQGFRNPRFSPDGKRIVAERYGFPWTRPRYFGSAAAQLVMVEVATGKVTTLEKNDKQHLWPFFSPDGQSVYCVTYEDVTPSTTLMGQTLPKITDTPNRTPNLWRYDLRGNKERVTSYVGEQVRHPSISRGGEIAFEREGRIYVLSGTRERRVDIYVPEDPKVNEQERQVLTQGATEAVISPDEKTFAFVVGDEVWTVPLEKPEGRNKDDAKRLTEYAGWDGEIVWSKDGKKIFFISDREGNFRLYSLDVQTLSVTPIWTRESDVTEPEVSPDGKYLAFWSAGSDGGLYLWKTDGSEPPKKIFHQPGSHFFGTSAGEFEWSPDSRWIALTRRQPGGTTNVWIVSVESGDVKRVTERNVGHFGLAWSADGKYLYFSRTGSNPGYYLFPLQPEEEAPSEIRLKYEKPKEPLKIEISFENTEQRLRPLFTEPLPLYAVSDKETGKIYFLSGAELWSSDYDGKNVRKLLDGVSQFQLSGDGKTGFALSNGKLLKIRLGDRPSTEEIAFRAEWVQDREKVRQAAFVQFWRMYHRGFYDGNFHGRDWQKIRERYEPQLKGVAHRREFAELLNMMVGELEASHTEVSPAPGGISPPTVAHPGFLFDYTYEGPGIRIKGLYEGAPGTFAKTRLSPGEYVLAINGVDVTLNERLWDVLHNQLGRDLTLLVNSTPSKEGAREVKYGALSLGAWSELRYRQWVESNRKRVEEVSGGKIGYIHIRGMGGGDRTRFEEEFYEYKQGKEGMIIDVRFNGGGNISDTLIDWLERRPHGYYRVRDGWVELAPTPYVWDKPTVVLHNEHSYSNAEMFPYAMKERRLATLIGMPTPGYVIWTWESRLVDGTGIRMPMSGVFRMDGTPMENLGQKPDILVPWSNEDFMAGKDPQLDRALEELLKQIHVGRASVP